MPSLIRSIENEMNQQDNLVPMAGNQTKALMKILILTACVTPVADNRSEEKLLWNRKNQNA
jgi:hypothetical protein